MSLKYTLLGFLNYGEMTGYELKRHLDISTQNMWYASLSQIYPTLQRLEQEEWISSRDAPQEGKPDRKYYKLEKPGREALHNWLHQLDAVLPRQKNINLLKLFFSGSLPKSRILHLLESELDLHLQKLTSYEKETSAYIAEIVGRSEHKREAVMWDAVRRLGIEREKTTIRWLEDTIKLVEGTYDE